MKTQAIRSILEDVNSAVSHYVVTHGNDPDLTEKERDHTERVNEWRHKLVMLMMELDELDQSQESQ